MKEYWVCAECGVTIGYFFRQDNEELLCSKCVNPLPEKIIESVNHPSHYGGEDNTYEAIKVIEAWNLGFHLGNTLKYISRAGKKGAELEDLEKAAWYIQRRIEMLREKKT